MDFLVLEIIASHPTARAAIGHIHNKKFISKPEVERSRTFRETTPLLEAPQVTVRIYTSSPPRKPELGWTVGRDKECDIYCGPRRHGVGRRQFGIRYNWKTMTMIFCNLSSNGTQYFDPEKHQNEVIHSQRILLPGQQYYISAGLIELILRVPLRNNQDQLRYHENLQKLRRDAQLDPPSLADLGIQSQGTCTPHVVGFQSRYIMGRCIGAGLTGIVREAIHYETGDCYAVKDYSTGGGRSKVAQRMMREFAIVDKLKLKHDHVIKFIDSTIQDGSCFLVMELASASLAEKPCSKDEVPGMLRQCSSGLAYIHSQNIIHRDIKPQNILLVENSWKIADFDLSSNIEEDAVARSAIGSPAYAAPEIGIAASYTYSVDIWSLGVVGVALTVGFGDLIKLLGKGPAKRETWDQSIGSRAKEKYLKKMLQIKPEDRPTAAQLEEELSEEKLSEEKLSEEKLSEEEQSSGRPQKRPPSLLDREAKRSRFERGIQ